MEILITVNKHTGVKRYFKNVNEFMKRISVWEYDFIADNCVGMRSSIIKNTVNHTRTFNNLIFKGTK